MSRLRRRLPILAVGSLLVVLIVVAVTVRPATTDDGPGGTAVLRRLLEARGVKVSSSDRPQNGPFFLAHDLRTAEQVQPILDWVRAGGRAVVADPGSRLLLEVGILPSTQVAGFAPEQTLEADCVAPAIVGVERIAVESLDALYRPAAGVGCFRRGDGAFLVRRTYGDGEIVGLGGLTPLTNEYLDDEDDVVLAWNLLGAPGSQVVFGSPLPTGAPAPQGLWGLLPDAARVVIWQIVLAAVIFAAARGRRLGRPVDEPVPSQIPATELVVATGELYRRARVSSHAAGVLVERFRARVGRRLGLGPRPGEEELARAVADVTGAGAEDLSRPGGLGEVQDESALVTAARELERLERRMEGGEAWETPARR